MIKYLLMIILITCTASAQQFGSFIRSHYTNTTYTPNSIQLAENQRITFTGILGNYRSSSDGSKRIYLNHVPEESVSLEDRWGRARTNQVYIALNDVDSITSMHSSKTLYGPCTLIIRDITDGDFLERPDIFNQYFAQQITYMVEDLTQENQTNQSESEAVYVSLNSIGDRVAVGTKDDEDNTVAKVYQFDGVNWIQVGEDIE